MTCREQYFSICNFVSPESTTLLRMKCQCLVSRHWLGSISVYDKQHANFMNLLEGFLFPGNFAQLPPVANKLVYAFPSRSSSLLAQHGPFIHGLFEIVMLSEIFDRLETILRQNNFEQFSFAYVMVSPLKMTG